MKRRWSVVLALTFLVAGCTGVPSSSEPVAIQTLGIQQPGGDRVVPPTPGADARLIVLEFLEANASSDLHHNAARAYLTPQAKNRWSDMTVTVLANMRVGLVDHDKVPVTGTEVGTISNNGIYTPALAGDGNGNGGQPDSQSFTMKQVDGQWRIDELQTGLLITTAQFNDYRQRPVYFFDVAEQHLVPDPRYTDIGDPSALAQWLIGQLALGTRPALQSAETTELPAQTDPTRVVLTPPTDTSGITKIEIPGANQLSGASRNRLAAQVAVTLVPQVTNVDQMQITDGGVPVQIPMADSTVFTEESVATPYVPTTVPVELYYVDVNGLVRDESGAALPGSVGHGGYGLDSVAIADRNGSDGLLVAGTRANNTQLDIGSVAQGLHATDVHGRLSRPDWAPGLSEVWIGDGGSLLRVLPNGKSSVVPVTAATGKATGRVSAVRLSPEGSRVALVLTNPDGSAQVWVGAVVRGSGPVQVVALTAISPQGIDITDIAWNDELKLFAIGHVVNGGAAGVYEVQVDGSLWTDHGIGNLPQAPDSITVAQDEVASVSADGTVWNQSAGSWASLQGELTHGTNPIYSS